jgi:hypothetical protein
MTMLGALGKERNIITDGMTQTVNDLIVTTVPYHCSKEQKSVWLDRGNTLRRQLGSSWLILHHAPPMGFPGSIGEEREAKELLLRYRPEWFISGHSHQFPYLTGRSWTQVLGSAFAGARTAFGRALSKSYYFGHKLRAGAVGDVE